MHLKTLRVARPTDDINRLRSFYIDGLGLEVLAEFSGHDGFDGLILGDRASPYHLEFTRRYDHLVGRAPSEDNLLVYYIPDRIEWEDSVQRMKDAGFLPVTAFNPYWDKTGNTFEDADGYRIVLQNAGWNQSRK